MFLEDSYLSGGSRIFSLFCLFYSKNAKTGQSVLSETAIVVATEFEFSRVGAYTAFRRPWI